MSTNGQLPTVLLSGTAGAGKSVVAKEIHELLQRAGARNAVIDLDAVGRVWPVADEPYNSNLVVRNLAALWPNYAGLNLEFLVLARVLLSAGELADYHKSLPFLDLRVVRLEAPVEQIRDRLEAREPGVSQSFLVRVSPEIAADLRSNDLDDFVISNGSDRSVTEVALEILKRLDWPVPEG